jgi:DNA-binding response OmpR family regulator
VRLLFPIVGSTQPVAVAAPASPAAPTRRARVLLVEDDPAVRQNLERLLSAHGFDADCVPGAADARARLAADATRYACVVTDVVMPGEDGMHLTSWIRATHATIPVLLISGHTGTALDDPHDLGEHIAFLRKPFSGQELASRLDALIDRRAPEAR